jgi:hypothetical protein
MKEDKNKDRGSKAFNFEKSNVLTSFIMGLTHLRSNIRHVKISQDLVDRA